LSGLDAEKVAGLVGLAWLIGAFLVMARSIRSGRELAAALAARHPEIYEALGRPLPGYLQSVRRDRFAQFIARREFENLGDPALAAEFEAYRRSEARSLMWILASLLVVGLVFLLVRLHGSADA